MKEVKFLNLSNVESATLAEHDDGTFELQLFNSEKRAVTVELNSSEAEEIREHLK